MTIATNGPLYLLLIGAVLCLMNETLNAVRNWWHDVKLRRAMRRRTHLRDDWTAGGADRLRAHLIARRRS